MPKNIPWEGIRFKICKQTFQFKGYHLTRYEEKIKFKEQYSLKHKNQVIITFLREVIIYIELIPYSLVLELSCKHGNIFHFKILSIQKA